ncbi:chorismate mutase [Streptomyces achromogenes]|uniref:chorismate mutase n=1 Tax=Streptomyces achromogenes TaxID=67255 RepID=UPI00367D4662
MPLSDITVDRSGIDRLDEALIALVEQRRAVSERVQRRRVAAGGTRVDLAREQAVFRRYEAALGSSGVAIARELLHLCRGR